MGLVGPAEKPVTEHTERGALVQRYSTPWGVTWHALECFDYDLNGEFGPWAPPPPFVGHTTEHAAQIRQFASTSA